MAFILSSSLLRILSFFILSINRKKPRGNKYINHNIPITKKKSVKATAIATNTNSFRRQNFRTEESRQIVTNMFSQSRDLIFMKIHSKWP